MKTPTPFPCTTTQAADQKTLLTTAHLHLPTEVKLQVPSVGRIMVKYQPARRYLSLTPQHWTVLKAFEGGRTVPSVLKQLIHERNCIPLREFYELVLKAHEAGVLQNRCQPPPPEVIPARWRASVRSDLIRYAALISLMMLVGALLVHPVALPVSGVWAAWGLGWLLTCLATSAGFALAATGVQGADCDLYRPRWVWKTLFPGFRIDTDDVVMAPAEVAIDTALARIMPQALLVAAAAVHAPALSLPLVCGLLYPLAPLQGTPMMNLLCALHRSPRLSVARDFRFKPNCQLLPRLRSWLEWGEVRFALLRLGYTAVWLLLVALAWGATAQPDFGSLLETFIDRGIPGLLVGAVLALLGLGLATTLALLAVGLAQNVRNRFVAWRRFRTRDDEASADQRPTIQQIHEFLGRTYPFQLLPLESRMLMAASMRQHAFDLGSTIVRVGEKSPRLHLLYAGRVSTQYTAAAHRETLLPGSIFAESALLRDQAEAFSIRCEATSIVLTLDRDLFEQIVLPYVSSETLLDAAQKIAFLRQIPFSRHWPPHLMALFARRSHLQTFAAGEKVLSAGRENSFFFLLQEGELSVQRQGRRLGKLVRGDFFGEISVLQNSVTTADVVGLRPGRYLTMSKHDFLAFMAQDSTVSLQLESIASRRLGRPLFPLPSRAIELLRA